jgi:hypothetical protein
MSFTLSTHSQDLVDKLATDARNNGLVLIVGSGINGTAAPMWSELLGQLLDEAIKKAGSEDKRIAFFPKQLKSWCQKEFDVLAQASIVKELLGPEFYRLKIQQGIYPKTTSLQDLQDYCRSPNGGDKVQSSQFELLRSIAELCQLDAVKAVATFNFDTLLEYAIKSCKVKAPGERKVPHSYFGRVWTWDGNVNKTQTRVIPVYHVHGLLPPPSSVLKNREMGVVMSYDEYFDRNADPFSWETSSLIHLLRHYCILWIGVSLRDWNMLRLLDAARSGRSRLPWYCIQALPSIASNDKCKKCKQCKECNQRETCPKCEKCENCKELADDQKKGFQSVAMRFRAELFSSVGVQLIVGGSEHADIPQSIQLIRDVITKQRVF